MSILNIINSFLAYQDAAVTDSPTQRDFDYSRRLQSLSVQNPSSERAIIPPGASLLLFDGTVPSSLAGGTSSLSIAPLSGAPSLYRVTVTGPAGFRTARTVSGFTTCAVTINNFATATFQFDVGVTISGVVAGDVLRISGAILADTGPFAFSPLNSGYWTVLYATSTAITCVRPPGQAFSGVAETVSPLASDLQAYSSAGVQVGNSVSITGTFSTAVQGTYKITAVTPQTFDVFSSIPLPAETATYVASTLTFYSQAQRIMYVEVDQPAALQLNGDSSNSNLITPIVPGDPCNVGFMSKIGTAYSATIVNTSVNPMNALWFTCQ